MSPAADVIALLSGAAAVAALLSGLLIRLTRPLLVRYALARPNARSSHAVPTPQGGGIAVLAAALAAGGGALAAAGVAAGPDLAVLAGAAIVLAVLGAVDDIRPLSPGFRAIVQVCCVAAVVAAGGHGRILPAAVPPGLETAILVAAGLWWVNLVNFMDGIDWITLAEFVPLTAALSLFALAGHLPASVAIVAAALLGALLGFAPSNRPRARLFLGDVGSLPIGLVTGWLLLGLAGSGALAAALLLPMYYAADATLTLARRIARRERIWEAHRLHCYQRAVDRGMPVLEVDARIFALNVALGLLAAATLAWPAPAVQIAALAAGCGLTGWTLRSLAGGAITAGTS